MAKKELSALDSLLANEAGSNLRNFKKMLREPLIDGVNYNKDAEDMITAAITKVIGKAKAFAPGKPAGAIGETQKYINELVAANPEKKAKELERLADKTIIGDMNSRTFANKVSAAKNLL